MKNYTDLLIEEYDENKSYKNVTRDNRISLFDSAFPGLDDAGEIIDLYIREKSSGKIGMVSILSDRQDYSRWLTPLFDLYKTDPVAAVQECADKYELVCVRLVVGGLEQQTKREINVTHPRSYESRYVYHAYFVPGLTDDEKKFCNVLAFTDEGMDYDLEIRISSLDKSNPILEGLGLTEKCFGSRVYHKWSLD